MRGVQSAGLFLVAVLLAGPVAAEETAAIPAPPAVPETETNGADKPVEQPTAKTVCELIEEAARTHRIPIDYFTRLIWQESGFKVDAISPKGAQGIAQFMPGTAALRSLSDPFDPELAIVASAKYLKELSVRFGNLGFAAAAYNAGEQRVSDWLTGAGGLPLETQDYVMIITGRSPEDWTVFNPNKYPGGLLPGPKVSRGCLELASLLAKPGVGAQRLEKVPRAAWAPWGVQVAGNFSLNRAMASYSSLQKRHPKILGGKAPMVVRGVNKSRGQATLFHIRAPAGSREAAAKLCQSLQASGVACVVFRTK